MIVKSAIRKNMYYDSVTLMLISKEIKQMQGVEEALIGMGTDLNLELVANLNMDDEAIRACSPNDFFISVLLEDESLMPAIEAKVEELLNHRKTASGSSYRPVSLDNAFSMMPDANMVIVSVPGKFAAPEVRKALENNCHVMLFSDNVSIEDEKALKELAVSKGLLMMGPDCGTSIINHVPLAFANVVRKGPIGIVGASGTGTQEVSVLVDRFGSGISQVIGTGGRDLRVEIGGLMMIQSFEALMDDPDTKVIVLISKPPAESIAAKILGLVKNTEKPVVVHFIGGNPDIIRQAGAVAGLSLEDTAHKAVALANGKTPEDFIGFDMPSDELEALILKETSSKSPSQKYLRGLYTGGTLADETMKLLDKEGWGIWSNVPLKPEWAMENVWEAKEHTVLDLGDDQFTVGRPHPMIDPTIRNERLVKDTDAQTAVLLMDLVLGYGAHPNPALELAVAARKARKKAADLGGSLTVIASICGTEGDPQGFDVMKKEMEAAGVIVMPSNAQAAHLAGRILKAVKGAM